MSQLTLRLPDRLASQLKGAAGSKGQSVNRWATDVLRAAVDPCFAGSVADELRERLARAGRLTNAPRSKRARPSPKAVARARAAASRGRRLSAIVSEGRG